MIIRGHEIDTVLFDKDGTLIDFPSIWVPWLDDIHKQLLLMLPDCGLSLPKLQTAFGIRETDDGIDPKSPLAIAGIEESITILAFLLYETGVPWDSALTYARGSIEVANEKQNSSTHLKSMQGIERVLRELKMAAVTLGVLTADDTDKAWQQLEHLGMAPYFQFVIGSDQVEHGKPFPDLAYLARDRHGVNLGKAIMIGDTSADIQLGKRAGVKMTVGIVSYAKDETDHLQEADVIIHTYDELLTTGNDAKEERK